MIVAVHLSREEMASIPLVWVPNRSGVSVRVRSPTRVRQMLLSKRLREERIARASEEDRPSIAAALDEKSAWDAHAKRYKRAVVTHRVPIAPCESFAVPSIPSIIAAIAQSHGLQPGDITGKSRSKIVLRARTEAVREVARRKPDLSFPQIGAAFRRDHTTIMYALGRLGRQEGA